MVKLFKINDEINKTTTTYNEILLLKTLIALESRNKNLYLEYVRIYEDLFETKFDKDILKLM